MICGRAARAARPWRLDRLGSTLAGADADAVQQRQDEDLAVADFAFLAGAAGLDDGIDGGLDELVVHPDLELDLAQQVDGVLMAAVDLGMALLATETLNIADGQADDFDLVQRFLDSFQFGRLDDGLDHFHGLLSLDGCRW